MPNEDEEEIIVRRITTLEPIFVDTDKGSFLRFNEHFWVTFNYYKDLISLSNEQCKLMEEIYIRTLSSNNHLKLYNIYKEYLKEFVKHVNICNVQQYVYENGGIIIDTGFSKYIVSYKVDGKEFTIKGTLKELSDVL